MQEKFAFLVAKRYAYKNFFVIFIGMSSFFLILRDALLNMLYEEWFHELTTYVSQTSDHCSTYSIFIIL